MHSLLAIFLILFTSSAFSHQDEGPDNFSKTCKPFTCGSGTESLEIRFPLRLLTAPTMCGHDGFELTCSANNETILSLPSLPPLKVTNIDYWSSEYTVKLPKSDNSPCPLQNLSSLVPKLKTPNYSPQSNSISFVRCPTKFAFSSVSGMPSEHLAIAGPLSSCYPNTSYFVYVVYVYLMMDVLPQNCEVFWTGGEIPAWTYPLSGFNQWVQDFSERREVRLSWLYGDWPVNYMCSQCEWRGKHCGYDWGRNQSFCISHHHHGANVILIAGTSISGLLIILSVSAILFYVSRQSAKDKETRLKVERFLSTYKTTKPTRHTYSRIKKITKRFRHKLGQGGFGSVYKGELPNGIPVAVKMLENTKGEVEEFINEVATIGRIHHFNVVRLLGFCSEGTRRALVYEFMQNESLEKFIFSKEAKSGRRLLSTDKMLEIAIGIARGIEYLHQGCDQRILHFDIKPHNILLDHNFVPKVSDFGLAKLCSRDHSFITTMTAARGTRGYIAPEIYSRNFGEVSYKSDVYSFGMMLLEMVSGKRNIEPSIENQDQVYFPEWIYNRLISGEDIGLVREEGKEEENMKKLVIVALWCIQLSPNDRPTMTKVIQLLIGNLESLQIPPQPFIPTHQDNGTYISRV